MLAMLAAALVLADSYQLVSSTGHASVRATTQSCESDAGFHTLDFWLGTWQVNVNGIYDGTDTVTKILRGCAVIEDWRDAGGSRGKSLFYYDPFAKDWTQVWVTEEATSRGGLKIKKLVARYPDGGTRFQGSLPGPPGSRTILDRTTLTPRSDGTIRQVIEISIDGGTTWRRTYDAIYKRVAGS